MSLEIIIPGCGSTLFSLESLDFPGIRAAQALGREGVRGFCPAAVPEVLVARALGPIHGTLLAKAPLALLTGLWITAFATGASTAIVALEAPSGALEEGIAALERQGLLAGLSLQVKVVADSFMAGEDAALLRLLEGQPALACAARVELDGRSALVRSAEELVNVAARAAGRVPARLIQVQGAVRREALVEVPPGATLRSIIFDLCGGMKGAKALKFVLAGGPTGCFLPADGLEVPLPEGVAVLRVGDAGACVVDEARRCLAFTALENCGICTICREGAYQLKELLEDGVAGKTKGEDEALVQELGAALQAGSLCAVGRTAPNPLLTGLQHFPEEFEAHFKRKRCPALVCKAYVTFHILGETCTGCGKCLAVCPEAAIEGEADYIHVIDPGACTKCGLCFDICPPEAAAVVKAGALKPRTPKEPIPVGTWKKR